MSVEPVNDLDMGPTTDKETKARTAALAPARSQIDKQCGAGAPTPPGDS